MAKAILTTATFRPAEIEMITGITPDNLRDLRKRGYVEGAAGWTAASLLQTARLIIVSRLSAIGIPPAASWEIARHENAAEQVVAFALDFDGAVVDHNGRAIEAGLHLGNELPQWKLPLSTAKRRRFLCVSDWKSAKAFFTNDAKKIYFTQREVPLLTLDLKAYGSLLFDKAAKPLIQIGEDNDAPR
jgi:hypothetical protein